MARTVSGEFSATGQSASFSYRGEFNVSLSGFGSGAVNVERSHDNGSTWNLVETFTSNAERYAVEPQVTALWRFNCTSYTSGPIIYRFSGQ
jgi:hypothetical protein